MTKPFLAPSLVALRAEINARWPNRDKASDGWIGDAAHSARDSDHNPDSKGMVHAIDVDKDGIDVPEVLAATIGEPRVNYVIHARKIYSRVRNFRSVPYTGSNPHDKHVHISILYTSAAESDVSPWLEDDVKPEDFEKIRQILRQEIIDVLKTEQMVPNQPVDPGGPQGRSWTVAESLSASDLKADRAARVLRELQSRK